MIEIKKPEITYIKRDIDKEGLFGRFILEPLEKGYGHTLGNTLRRVLLSSLPGVAISEVKIDGILHEFSCIPEVREDVTEICLNFKKIVAAFEKGDNEPKKGYLNVIGPKMVTAGDIECDEGVEIINPDLHIANIGKGGSLNIELNFEKGRGFVPSERRAPADEKLSTLILDTQFSPVLKASYKVEATRVGQDINYDRLIIDVWTDGSIKPDEAISMAASFFDEYINIFIQYKDVEAEKLVLIDEEVEEPDKNFDIPIKELEFSVRSRNCLRQANMKALGDLTKMSAQELLQLKNFGKKSLVEIREKLGANNLALKGEVVEPVPEEEN